MALLNRLKAAQNVNKRNQEIVKVYQEWKKLELSDITIYRKHISPIFFISLKTFRKILGDRLKVKEKEIQKEIQKLKKNQP